MDLEQRLPVDLQSPRLARDAVQRALVDAVSSDRLSDILVATSEVVTNAIRHAEMSPDEEIVVALREDDGRVRIEVEDSGTGFVPPPRSPHGELREGGYGLRLVDDVADCWGVELGPPTRVWLEFHKRDA